ncbi:MAG: acyltransferase [Rhizobiales bacterium]|nr:acyltransferase [Hyphomicrobiales bacterium]NRB13431.1 acyltransferase [Hyphomicrobiales bacterium]
MRYLELDALRGMAALAVVLFHYTTRYYDFFPNSPVPTLQVNDLGYGVNLFFVISGFVISFSAASKNNAFAFLKGRILRLYPLYWAALIITFATMTIFPHPELTVNFATFIMNFSMLQKFAGFANVDGAYWTLAIEWVFYSTIIGLLLVKSFSKIHLFVGFMIVTNIALAASNLMLENPIILPLKLALVYNAMAYFACGVSFYLYKTKLSSHYILAAFVVLMANHLNAFDTVLLLDLALFALFWLFTTDNLRWLAIRPLVYLGNLSYALYLIHQNIGYVIINNLIDYVGPNMAIGLAIVTMMIVAHVLTEATNKLVGKFLNWKKATHKAKLNIASA